MELTLSRELEDRLEQYVKTLTTADAGLSRIMRDVVIERAVTRYLDYIEAKS